MKALAPIPAAAPWWRPFVGGRWHPGDGGRRYYGHVIGKGTDIRPCHDGFHRTHAAANRCAERKARQLNQENPR